MFAVLLVLLGIGCFELVTSSVSTVNIAVNDLLHMQHGMGWPYVLQLLEGQDALVYLKSLTRDDNIESCYVTSPLGEKFNVNSPPSSKYEKWSNGCGVRIKAIVKKDEGRWRLTATAANHTYIGWSQMHVHSDISEYRGPNITLQDGQDTTVHLFALSANSYCYVEQPFSEGSLIPGHCAVSLPRATRAVQGVWNVFVGIPGRIQELHIQRQVTVKSESLDSGYIHDRVTNQLHLYCNLMHSSRQITFCRFQKTTSSSGYNVADGLSDGSHSYYGKGLLYNQCGMTIDKPANADFGTWRCSLGTHFKDQSEDTPMQALISTSNSVHSAPNFGRIVYKDEDTSTIFVQADHPFTLRCRATVSLQYCWFQHPNGTQYTPVQTPTETDEDDLEFKYTGQGFQSGDCSITFNRATSNDTGTWSCHMGARNSNAVEITDTINVKVTGALAANRQSIATKKGDTVHLFCHTSNGNRLLEYCRFFSPNFVGINLRTNITEENAIDGNYYFTSGRNDTQGDCSLTIKSVRQQDIGTWTCAGLIHGDRKESSDTVSLYYDENPSTSLSQASIVGMTVGITILVTSLAGFLVYKKFGLPSQWRYTTSQSRAGVMSMSDVTSRPSNGSGSSEDSANSFNSDSTNTTVRFTS